MLAGEASEASGAREGVDAGGEAGIPPRGARAVVGGVEYTVGGWGAYEIARRRERWEATRAGGHSRGGVLGGAAAAEGRPGREYAGRTYIHADDAVRSVLGGGAGPKSQRRAAPLQRAATRLADALARMEDRLCDPADDGVWECAPASALRGTPGFGHRLAADAALHFTIPPLTSADLRAFAADPEQAADPDTLSDLGEDALSVAAAVGEPAPLMPALAARGLPPLPARAVPVSDDEAVLRLESAVAPYVATVEGLQAALATRLDATAAAVERALARKRGGTPTGR
jgi:hypothetical protein